MPPSLTFPERWRIRRAGHRDARYQLPLAPIEGFVSTPWREAIWSRRDRLIEELHEASEHTAMGIAKAIAVTGSEIDRHRNDLRRLEEQIDAIRTEPVDERRMPGERTTPSNLVRLRRRRERDRSLAPLRLLRDRLNEQLGRLEGDRESMQVELQRIQQQFAIRANRIHLAVIRERAVYDQALLHRHPHRFLLAENLDPTIKPLPRWVQQWVQDSEVKQ
jgi:hypothetical protein